MKSLFASAAVALSMLSGAAQAATLSAVDPVDFLSPPGPTVAEARYRLSNTNWDMAIVQPGGPNGSTPTAGLGNVAQLSARTYDFTLTHAAGTGFVFAMTNTATSATTTLNLASLVNFNALRFTVQSTTDTGSMSVSNLAFTYGAGLTGPATLAGLSLSGNVGESNSWLASTSNLALFDWSVSGTLAGTKGITGCDECVKFSLRATNAELPAPIPLPAAGFMLIGALAGLGLVARRRRAA